MGASGIGLFDDDDGADFAAEILRSDRIDIVIDALRAVPAGDWEYLENPEGMRALLAAELIADQMGHESGELPDELHSWIHQFSDAEESSVRLARSAVERVLRKSETRELFKDSSDFEDWLLKTRRLLDRLSRR